MFRDFTKYEIYSDGKIWSYSRNKFLKPITHIKGYQRVHLTDNEGNAKMYMVHRVVWEAVTGKPIPEGYEINHISENKTENSITNLELMSHNENVNYGSGIERGAKGRRKQVGAFNKNGELVMTFSSTVEANRQGFDCGNVSKCCRGKLPRYKGFEWRYI